MQYHLDYDYVKYHYKIECNIIEIMIMGNITNIESLKIECNIIGNWDYDYVKCHCYCVKYNWDFLNNSVIVCNISCIVCNITVILSNITACAMRSLAIVITIQSSLFFFSLSPSFAFHPLRGISHVRNNFSPNILA